MLPERLVEDIKALADAGFAVVLTESGGMACAVFSGHPLPRGYNRCSSDLLLRLPLSYPNGKPDMFWLESDVLLANGSVPKSAEHIETYLDRKWRRFSWHMTHWNPAQDDFRTYLEFVNSRLAKSV